MINFPLFPEQASEMAERVDGLYFFLVGLTVFFTGLIALAIVVFIFRYRSSKEIDRRLPKFPTMKIEVTWTVIPLALTLGIFSWGAALYHEMQNPPEDALELHVLGRQWMWKVYHPEGNREINQLHVPLGETVKLIMSSEDVIHSFYLPAFRVKQDVLPGGKYTVIWFTPKRTGTYHLFCAEYCGLDHSRMRGYVHVMEPSDYEAWLRSGTREALAVEGERLYRELGCSGCHAPGGPVRAPPLEGIYGKPAPLESGEIVRVDDQYLRDSILLPNLQIAAGYEPLMPTFAGQINEEDLIKLIAYIKSLANELEGRP